MIFFRIKTLLKFLIRDKELISNFLLMTSDLQMRNFDYLMRYIFPSGLQDGVEVAF